MEKLEFEASVKSGITVDVKYVKEHDEIVSRFKKEKSKVGLFLILLALTVGAFFVNKILMVVLGIITLVSLVYTFLMQRKKAYLHKDSFLKEIYEEGLLVPGIIINTNPLRIMALANITATAGAPIRHAAYILDVKHLPNTNLNLYEKVPCSCMFSYYGGDYHDAFQPHPLCWATENVDEIRNTIHFLDTEEGGNCGQEWGLLEETSKKFPYFQPDHMILFDEKFEPIGCKQYLEDDYIPLLTEENKAKFPKVSPNILELTDDIPAVGIYNKLIELANKCEVSEYINVHCDDEDYSPLTNPGYFNYIGDPGLFLKALERRNIYLADGEYPLIAGHVLLTNRGCWKKQEFTPWAQVDIYAAETVGNEIETRVFGKCVVQFKLNTAYYENKERFTKEDLDYIMHLETQRLSMFLHELKKVCMTE